MKDYLDLIERTLSDSIPDERPAVLSEAMRYAVGTGGKRIRPLICLASAVAVGGKAEDAKHPAAAIELLHNYTLIHDDLPAMDNDRERRGKPTVWVKFGEANAILAGDALLALAYQVAAKAPRNVAAIVDVLGEKGVGVVQGQVEDVSSCKFQVSSSRPETCNSKLKTDVEFIYAHKTADLFIAAAAMGALAGGGSAENVASLKFFALQMGMAFQLEDDLIDGDSPFSREDTEKQVVFCTNAAIAALDQLPGDTAFLRGLVQKLVGRKA